MCDIFWRIIFSSELIFADTSFFTTAYSIQAAVTPLLSSLCLQFTNNNYDMNFGLARSMGFLGYSLSAAVMGMLTSHFGPEVIIPVYALIYLILIGVLISFPVPQKDLDAHIIAGNDLIKRTPLQLRNLLGNTIVLLF